MVNVFNIYLRLGGCGLIGGVLGTSCVVIIGSKIGLCGGSVVMMIVVLSGGETDLSALVQEYFVWDVQN